MSIGFLAGRRNATGLFAGIGILALFWLGRYWRTTVPILLLVSCTDGFLKHLISSSALLILKDALVVAIIIGMVVDLALHRKERPQGRWQGLFPWVFYFMFIVANVALPHLSIASQIAGFRARVFFSLLIVVGAVYFSSPRVLVRAAWVFVIGITIAAGTGIIQVALGVSWESLGVGFLLASQKYQSFSSVIGAYFLAYGTMVDPESLGLGCGFGLLLAMGMLGLVKGSAKVWVLIAMLIMVTSLLLSGARGAILGTGFGLVLVFALAFRWKETRSSAWLALIVVGLGLPLAGLASGGSNSERFSSESTTYGAENRAAAFPLVSSALQKNPLGLGIGSAGAGGAALAGSDQSTPIDNYYLAILYETGPIGLILLVVVLVTIFSQTIRSAFASQSLEARVVFIGFAGAQIELIVSAFLTQGSWDYAPVSQAFWLFAGATLIPRRVVEAVIEKSSRRKVTLWQP